MSTFEDDIRRAMTDHDDEAPREADLLRSLEQAHPPRRRRGGWYVPFAVAVAVAAVVLGSVSVGRLLAGHQQKPALFSREPPRDRSGNGSGDLPGNRSPRPG